MPIEIQEEFEDFIINNVTFRHYNKLTGRRQGTLKGWVRKEALKFSPELYCNSGEAFHLFKKKLLDLNVSRENIVKLLEVYMDRRNKLLSIKDIEGDIAPILFGGFDTNDRMVAAFQLYGIKILNINSNIYDISVCLYPMFGEIIPSITSTARVNNVALIAKEILLHDFIGSNGTIFKVQELDFTSPMNYRASVIDSNTLRWLNSYFKDLEKRLISISNSEIKPTTKGISGFKKFGRV